MLDLSSREKKCLEVKLPGDKIIHLKMPKKKLYTRLAALEKELKATTEFTEQYDEILRLAADVLSMNTAGEVFTPEVVDDLLDIEDISLIVLEYVKFAGTATKDPN